MLSIISLDLGGKNTGFFSFTDYIKKSQSGTIIHSDSFGLSQVNRRAKRHGKRNKLRNKQAKRLFLLILQKVYGLEIKFLPDCILGLFNRRGYTYASFELKKDKIENLESDELREFLEEEFGEIEQESLEDFLAIMVSDEESFKNFIAKFKEFKASKVVKENKVKSIQSGLKTIEEILENHDKELTQGNLPRKKYFDELNAFIDSSLEVYKFFNQNNLNLAKMKNLIGNLSNFQLKQPRRYFNDKNMTQGDIWDAEKLHKITKRFIVSWHTKKPEDAKRRLELLSKLNKENIITFLTTTDPENTIPPYDDMNNRGAVKCHSLRLNVEYLNAHLPEWRVIVKKLANENLYEDLSLCTSSNDDNDATLLHRILDTSSQIDPYRLRADSIDGYVDTLGEKLSLELRKFAKNYYELVRTKVRTGIWTKNDAMFKRCDKNPPYKNNQIHNLLAEILGAKVSKEQFDKFEQELWRMKFDNKKLSTYCEKIEKLRKSSGNSFKSDIAELQSKVKDKLDKADKDNLKLLDEKILDEWSKKIAEFFNIEDKTRFCNYFSMAQLYTIIETKRAGFNKTCKFCSEENRFRSKTSTQLDNETGEIFKNANCQRLPSDTQRPFSGKIERYLDKLGYDIAKIKAKELENVTQNEIELKIILEQNRFEYEESIISAKIKNAKAEAKINLASAVKRHEKSIEDKNDRIKGFNDGICLYCGHGIESGGEIDHILPRSYTLRQYGTVFNGEGNLLYVHQKCNQDKLDKRKHLGELKGDIPSEKWIEENIPTSYKSFSTLSPNEQKAFRFALFLDENNDSYKKVFKLLKTDQSARVNGTQKYLAKKISEKLKNLCPDKDFNLEIKLVDAEELSRFRTVYAEQDPNLKKEEKQTPSSHAIDAVLAYLIAEIKPSKNKKLPTSSELISMICINNIKIKPISMIERDSREQTKNTAIFKDTIYQECFVPIFELDDRYYAGFAKNSKVINFENCRELTKENFEKIKSYLKEPKRKNNNLLVYEIDKQETIKLFHNVSRGISEDIEIAELLNKFNYNLLKTFVENAPKILKDNKKTSIKIDGKTILLPLRDEWEKFDRKFKEFLNSKGTEYKEKDGKYIDDENLTAFCKKYFNIKDRVTRSKARQKFSLPVKEGPSGGFRIRRKNHKGDDIFQLVAINDASSIGLEVCNNEIVKSSYVPLSILSKSKNISYKDPQKMEMKKHIRMDQFRDISHLKIIDGVKIFIAPATQDRPLVRCELALSIFRNLLNDPKIHFFNLGKEIFIDKGEIFIIEEKFQTLFDGLNFKPRSGKIEIIKITSSLVTINFVNENKTAFNAFYNSGKNINLND